MLLICWHVYVIIVISRVYVSIVVSVNILPYTEQLVHLVPKGRATL